MCLIREAFLYLLSGILIGFIELWGKAFQETSVPLHNKEVAQAVLLTSAQTSELPPDSNIFDMGRDPLGWVLVKRRHAFSELYHLSVSGLIIPESYLITVKPCSFSTLPGTW